MTYSKHLHELKNSRGYTFNNQTLPLQPLSLRDLQKAYLWVTH
jgi:hypothetical protein